MPFCIVESVVCAETQISVLDKKRVLNCLNKFCVVILTGLNEIKLNKIKRVQVFLPLHLKQEWGDNHTVDHSQDIQMKVPKRLQTFRNLDIYMQQQVQVFNIFLFTLMYIGNILEIVKIQNMFKPTKAKLGRRERGGEVRVM